MKTSKILPVGFLAITAIVSGLTIASAQNLGSDAPTQTQNTAQVTAPTAIKFERGERGHGGERGMFGAFLAQVDADNDGSVTQAEIDSFRAALITKADASGEGDISLDEFESIYLEMVRDRMVDTFQNLDSDGDGAVTQAEMDAKFGDIVSRMDRNDDGMLNDEDRRGRDRDAHERGGRHKGERHNDDRRG